MGPSGPRPVTERKRVTIHDVARSAGVSRQTVSRALNDKAEIDGTTKQRVLDTARALGYRPSRFARGLVRQDTTSVGLVVPDLMNPFFTEVASAALTAARKLGWHVVVYDTADDAGQELSTLAVIGSQVDAMVGYLNQPEEAVERLTPGIPVVFVDREPVNPRFSSIRIDAEDGVRQAIAHLVHIGHRRIAMLDQEHEQPSERRQWFLDAAAEHGLPIDDSWVTRSLQSVEGGEQAMDWQLDAHPDLDAVFTFNDIIAIGAMRRAKERGLRVPTDCAFIGFDGLSIGALVDPPLSSVHIDKWRLGTIAIEQVARMLTGAEPAGPDDLVVRASLLLRGSA